MTVTPRGGEPERFDEVVLATHSDQALAMLADPSDREHELLGAIPYQPNEAVLHTDRAPAAPPPRARGRAGTTTCSTSRTGKTTVTYHMNRLQSLRADREFCVTLNRTEAIDPAQDHPHDPLRAPGLHRRRRSPPRRATTRSAGQNRTHYCGAYWGWGFHEDGVVSGLRVAERFGARLT